MAEHTKDEGSEAEPIKPATDMKEATGNLKKLDDEGLVSNRRLAATRAAEIHMWQALIEEEISTRPNLRD